MVMATNSDIGRWGLSSEAVRLLEDKPELVSHLREERQKLPFPPGYTPTVIELLYESIVFVQSTRGLITFCRQLPENYQPSYTEVWFDNQLAVFLLQNGELLVNRITLMTELDQLMGQLA